MKALLKNTGHFIVLSVVSLLLNGCATMVGDNTRTVCLQSNP
jgi:outer membrane biogenesis lipoprotein LolB